MAEREPNVGIIGTHVDQSLSPVMHNAAYREMGVDLRYGTFQLDEAGDRDPGEHLTERLDELKDRGIVGLSVTMPFKVDVLESERLGSVSNSVKVVGACNTLSKPTDSGWVADNTDWLGAVQSLEEAGVKIEGKKALILGAGGTARAVAYGLAMRRAELVTIANRSSDRARNLARDLRSATSLVKFAWIGTRQLEELTIFDRVRLQETDILYNTTSVGQAGTKRKGGLPLSADAIRLLPERTVVEDAVYTPLETPLLRHARQGNRTIINGTRMLLWQAVAQVQIFTGIEDVPVDVMDSALQTAIA